MSALGQKAPDDLSPEHLTWLVERRSENQKSSLQLHLLIRKHEEKIRGDDNLENIVQGLIAVAFSLWRAVFLSDLSDRTEDLMSDAENFLGVLVLHNTIAYPQDRNARNWTFTYYMNNAKYRIARIAKESKPKILSDLDIKGIENLMDDKDWWVHHQTALNRSIENLEKVLSD